MMNIINRPVVIMVAIAAIALIVWLIRHDLKDKADFEKELTDLKIKHETDKNNNKS